MYYYIYDTFLSERKYEKFLDALKTRLLDLEIPGKHEQFTLLKSLNEMIDDEVKRGATTVVVVGNDKTFLKVVEPVARAGITLGLIPVGERHNELARCLGLPLGENACDTIAARKVINFDLGRAGQQYFLREMRVTKNLPRLSIGLNGYAIVPQADVVSVDLCNFYCPQIEPGAEKMSQSSALDGKLELVVRRRIGEKKWYSRKTLPQGIDTVIATREFELKSFEYLPIVLDGYKIVKTPVKVTVDPGALKVIVGRDRLPNIQ